MTVFYNKNRDRWAYHFEFRGDRYQGYCTHPKTGQTAKNKTEAKTIEAIIKGHVKSGEKTKEKQATLPTAGFAFAEPIAFYLKKLHGKASFSLAQGYAREILDWFGPATDMADITEETIAEYTAWCRRQTRKTYIGRDEEGHPKFRDTGKLRSPRTVNGYLSMIERSYNAFRTAPENKPFRHLIPPTPEIEYLPIPKRTPTPIPQAVSKDILDTADPSLNAHTRLAYTLCLHTGMRERECAQVTDRQYMEAERRIMLTPAQTKTDTGRAIPTNKIAQQVIQECRKLGDMLWQELCKDNSLADEYAQKYSIRTRGDIPLILYRPGGTGLPRPVKHIATTAWKRIKKEANIGYRWHDTRAAFCTETLAAGTDLKTVKDLAGHQSIATTEMYLKVSDPQMNTAVEALAQRNPTQVDPLTISAYKGSRRKTKSA